MYIFLQNNILSILCLEIIVVRVIKLMLLGILID